jgi:hypothetical protein
MSIRPLMLLFSLFFAAHAMAGDTLERLLATQPAAEAEQSFARGDRRHIVIPICQSEGGEVIPGWPLKDSPEVRKAMEEGRRPVTCAEIGDDPHSRKFMRLVKYAELYNQRLLELSSGRSK